MFADGGSGVLNASDVDRYNVEQKYFVVHSVVAASIKVDLRILAVNVI